MLIIKIIVLLWVITGTLLGVGFCYSDKSDGYFDGLDNFTLIVKVSCLYVIMQVYLLQVDWLISFQAILFYHKP